MFEKKDEEYYMNKGRECQKNEKYNDAIKYYNKAIKLNPKCWKAYNNIGLCYKVLKEYEKSLPYYNKAIEIAPDSAIPYTNRGNLYNILGKFDEALNDLNKAVELNKENNMFSYDRRGICYRDMGKYKEAIEDFTKALELAPEDIEIYYEEIGQCYTRLGDYKKGLFYLNNVIMMNKDSLFAYANKALCNQKLGNYNEAILDYTKFIEILDNYDNEKTTFINKYIMALYARGKCNSTLGNMTEAIEDFTKAIDICEGDIEIKNKNIDIYFELFKERGHAYMTIGDYKNTYYDILKFNQYCENTEETNFIIASCLWAMGKEDESKEYLEREIERITDLIKEDEDYRLIIIRANYYTLIKKYKETLADLDKLTPDYLKESISKSKKEKKEIEEEYQSIIEEINCLRNECIRLMNEKS